MKIKITFLFSTQVHGSCELMGPLGVHRPPPRLKILLSVEGLWGFFLYFHILCYLHNNFQ